MINHQLFRNNFNARIFLAIFTNMTYYNMSSIKTDKYRILISLNKNKIFKYALS